MQEPVILDRYRPLEQRGAGGSGIVEICWDTRMQRRVAIKHVCLLDAERDVRQEALTEARTGALLNHPNIVTVLDFEATADEALIIMEAIEGPTLAELLDEAPGRMLDKDAIAAIASGIGEALAFAHENQVLHLDIKPDNILVDQTGEARVSDFGVAELADAQGFGEAGGGTIGYMPPEQMTGSELDQRCDEFSFAVVVYEMLTGTNPFKADGIDRSLKLIDRFDVIAPSRLRRDIDPAVDEIVLSAMSPAREERFETIFDFLDTLAPYLGDPDAGRAELRARFAPEPSDQADAPPRASSLWGRVSPHRRDIASRALAAALGWWVATLGIVASGALSTPLSCLLGLLPAALCAATPRLGGPVSVLVVGAGLLYAGQAPVALGAAFVALAAAWWLLGARKGVPDTNAVLAIAPLGLVWLSPLAPLAAGFALPPRRALAAGAFASLLALLLAAGTGSASLLHFAPVLSGAQAQETLAALATNVQTWIIMAGWTVSAVLMAVFCSHGTRVSSVVGSCVAGAVQYVVLVTAHWARWGSWALPDASWGVSVLVAVVAMCVVGALGAPYRCKGED